MATKTKLERAVEKHAGSLNDAQREIVMSQLSVYKRNGQKLARLESELSAVNSRATVTRDELRDKQAQRMAITKQISDLTTANSRIAAELFAFMEE